MTNAAKVMQHLMERFALALLVTSLLAIGGASEPALAKSAAGTAMKEARHSDLMGLWLDHTGRGAVEITACGSKRKKSGVGKQSIKTSAKNKKTKLPQLCGRIVWLAQPFDKKGRPLTDKLNKKASRRNRKICGLKIIGKVRRISKRVYDNGWIYDPEKGKYFDVELRLKSNNILQVKGYLGVKALNKTFMWKRISGDHERCS